MLGIARAKCGGGRGRRTSPRLCCGLQNELFVAGAELATAPEAAERLKDGVSRITAEMVDELDAEIDRYMERVELPPKFVIPGGTALSAQLDAARAVLRRAERRALALAEAEELEAGGGGSATSTAARTSSMRWPASPTSPTPPCSRGDAGRRRRRATDASAPPGAARGSSTPSRSTATWSIVDEPLSVGGTDTAPSPTRLLAVSLASCTAVTVALYADRKGWDLTGLEVDVDFEGTPKAGERAHFDVAVDLPDRARRRAARARSWSSPASARCTGSSGAGAEIVTTERRAGG